MGSIIAVTGDGRGVGTTTVVSLVGSALSEQLRQTALIDGTREGTRLGDVYGIDPENTIVEMLRRGRQPVDVRQTGPHGADLFLSTAEAAWDAVPPSSIRSFYEHLRDRVEIALIDLGSIDDPSTVPWIGYADDFIVVTDSSGPNRVDNLTTIGGTFDTDFAGVVVNGVGSEMLEPIASKWADYHVPLLSVLPRDSAASASAGANTTVLSHDPDSELSTIGWQLADQLADATVHEPVLPDSVSIETTPSSHSGVELDPTDMVTEQRSPDEGRERPSASVDRNIGGETPDRSFDRSVDDLADFGTSTGGSDGLDGFDDDDDSRSWRDVPVGEPESDLDDGPSMTADASDGIESWRDDEEFGEHDEEFGDIGRSTTDGGLSDWGQSDSTAAPEDVEQSDDEADKDVEPPDDEIEAAFQEAMEQAKAKQRGDEEPSIEDLLE